MIGIWVDSVALTLPDEALREVLLTLGVYEPKSATVERLTKMGLARYGSVMKDGITHVYAGDESNHFCGNCGHKMDIVRPGKYQCPKCE